MDNRKYIPSERRFLSFLRLSEDVGNVSPLLWTSAEGAYIHHFRVSPQPTQWRHRAATCCFYFAHLKLNNASRVWQIFSYTFHNVPFMKMAVIFNCSTALKIVLFIAWLHTLAFHKRASMRQPWVTLFATLQKSYGCGVAGCCNKHKLCPYFDGFHTIMSHNPVKTIENIT